MPEDQWLKTGRPAGRPKVEDRKIWKTIQGDLASLGFYQLCLSLFKSKSQKLQQNLGFVYSADAEASAVFVYSADSE